MEAGPLESGSVRDGYGLFQPADTRRELLGQPIWFGFWLVVTAIGIGLSPQRMGHGTHTQLGLPPCPTAVIFNRPCPGCGLTTSWTAFLHGDFALAFSAHPIGPFLYLLFTASALLALGGYVRYHRLVMDSKGMNRFMIAVVVAVMAFGVVRFALVTNYSPLDHGLWELSGQQAKPKA